MSKVLLGITTAIVYLAIGFCQVYYIENDNYGVMSGLLTILVSLPFLLSWILMGIAAALFIGKSHSKGAKIAGFIILFIPTVAIFIVSVLLFSDGNEEEKLYPLLPILGLMVTYAIGIAAAISKSQSISSGGK
jgi:ABC-type spermidine/putrescine transport system permease subunit II